MEITEERRADVLILRIIGKLDASTSKALEDKILPLIASNQDKLVVELSQLDYISSAGLRIFLLAAKRMDEAKGKMILCSLKDSVKQVFEIAGFSSFLNLTGSTEEAIKEFPG
jgi:anti-sigma B factor antagonist